MAAVCGVLFGPPVEDVKAGACELTEGLLTPASVVKVVVWGLDSSPHGPPLTVSLCG